MLLEFLQDHTYQGIFIAIILRGIGVPLPEDIPLLIGGWLCGRGTTSLHIMFPVTLTGVLLADLISFGVGHHFGHHLPRLPLLKYIITEKRFEHAKSVYKNHGTKAIFLTRFLPTGKSPLLFVAGSMKVPFGAFIFIDTIGAVLNVLLLCAIGLFFGGKLEELIKMAHQSQWLIFSVITLITLLIVAFERRKKKRQENSEQHDFSE